MTDRYYLLISPDYDVLYEDMEEHCDNGFGDEILNEDLELGPRFSIIIPGIEEWLHRFETNIDFNKAEAHTGFDWKSWHWEGLHFAKAIYEQLPRCYDLYYKAPYEDHSGIIDEIRIDEHIDEIINQIGTNSIYEGCPCSFKHDLEININLSDTQLFIKMVAGQMNYKFCISINQLKTLRYWLERIIKDEQAACHHLYLRPHLSLYPQKVGVHREMARLLIWEAPNSSPAFRAYIHKYDFIRRLYDTVLTCLNVGINQDANLQMTNETKQRCKEAYEKFKSSRIEDFIDKQ